MVPVLILILFLLLLLVAEARATRNSVDRIRLRILVNGTRGKSSTTEYLAAALRAQGIRVGAKVTGEVPTLILADGRKKVIRRWGPARVQEQFRVIRLTARSGAAAMVLECMSIDPALQELESRHFRPHIYVLTNIGDDHREKLGRTREQQVAAMCRAIPQGCVLVTADRENLEYIRKEVDKKKCTLVLAEAPGRKSPGNEAGFSRNLDTGVFPENDRENPFTGVFPENDRENPFTGVFPENVILAAEAAAMAGYDREEALASIREYLAGSGTSIGNGTSIGRGISANSETFIGRQPETGNKIRFLNAFPANDPGSATLCLERWMGPWDGGGELVLLFNTRSDRPLRTDLFAGWIRERKELLRAVFITGDHRWRAYGRLKDLRPAVEVQMMGPRRIEGLAERLAGIYGDRLWVAGVGNFRGEGNRIIKEFEG